MKARIAAAGISRSFDIHRLKEADKNGCNWYLMPETADGWKPLDLILEIAEDVLESIHAELSSDYHLKPPGRAD